ncbi:MAG: phosphatidylserine/phosphatidylglycerophosphate/cardiolipin synthase family protein [candidate division Zixibacteria bacterium]|nr:phosphatidylserine/phosphatidylglycerophosphate/cardiolipin synthase family protein [candidate division Zixibacteria bacterium]
MQIDLLVDSGEFWLRLAADIAAARARVYVQTLSFEGDAAGTRLAEAMTASPAADKRIIVDSYTKYVLSDKFLYTPGNLFDSELRRENKATVAMIADLNARNVAVRFVNPVGPMLCRFACRNHKKIIVVDDRISYIGGVNFSDHNFLWHDMMLRIEDGPASDFLANDFLVSWDGGHFGGTVDLGSMRLLSLDGRDNPTAFAPIFELIDSATESIYVQSPYLTFPFCDRLRQARQRGVTVTVVTPEENNKKAMDGYIRWEAARGDFDLWLYPGRMTHLKAMLIDGRRLIAGSSNFDYFSYRFEQETMAVITDPDLISMFVSRVVEPDQAVSRLVENHTAPRSGYLRRLQMLSLGQVSAWFTPE